MSKNYRTTVDRRSFIAGGALALAGAAGFGALTGCSSNPATPSPSERNAEESADDRFANPAETLEADVVVVGAGISGLSAAVQAAQLGLKVVQLEVNENVGGNGLGTEGVFAIDSPIQKEKGINLTLADIVEDEQNFFKYKVNALRWKDMVEQSADSLAWLEENGVLFDGKVDSYPPLGRVDTMVWWKDGSGSNYVDPMNSKAQELGVDLHVKTRGLAPILASDGSIAGLYAENPDGDILQINAPAVILATGGFADNPDKLLEAGINPDLVFVRSFGGHMGDGIDIAVAAGAKDLSAEAAYLRETTIDGVDFATPFSMFFFTTGSVMWVNQEGERFADENCLSITSGCQSAANTNQGQTYTLFSEAILNAAGDACAAAAQEYLATNPANVKKADSIDELAQTFNIPADTLRAQLERYNGFCEQGRDDDFGKNPEKLVKLEAPFYLAQMSYCYMSSIGGLRTTRAAEVLHENGTPIPGLFAAGSDGCELYAGIYTISVPSSYNGNNVYSGRNAARSASAYLDGMSA